jgi:hypothetical protein
MRAAVLGLAMGGPCSRGSGDAARAHPSASAPEPQAQADGGPEQSTALPPIQVTLRDDTWTLSVNLDPSSPSGALEIRGEPFALSGLEVHLVKDDRMGSVRRDGGVWPLRATRTYRLRFTFDRCAHAGPTPAGQWPGPCGYFEGQTRPTWPASYELLVDVETFFTPGEDFHRAQAACVPQSGAGPSCKLEGGRSQRAL